MDNRARGDVTDDAPDRLDWDLPDVDARTSGAGSRRHLLFAAAVIPWVVVAILALSQSRSPDDAAAGDGDVAAAPMTPATTTSAPSAAPAHGPGDDVTDDHVHTPPATGAVRFGAPAVAGPGHASAVATAVVRDWLGSVGPELGVDVPTGPGAGYVEGVHVESVDLSMPPYAIVTAVAIVLEPADDTYAAATAMRVAVPVLLEDGAARPAGTPWRLPGPDLTVADVRWAPVEDPDLVLEVQEVLTDAGYRQVEIVGVERADRWPLRARARAVAPGEDDLDDVEVWLREHLGRLVVAGGLSPARGLADGAGEGTS